MTEWRRYFPEDAQFPPSLVPKLAEAVEIIETALERYGASAVTCFNGGKDATVLLDLVTRVSQNERYEMKVRPFYLQTPDEFVEMLTFLRDSERIWGVSLLKLETPSLKDGLRDMIEQHGAKAVFLGVRKSDVAFDILPFQETTPGWPKCMRVSPIFRWDYHDVWRYIDALSVPVCELYHRGFTSIGNKRNTRPNPALWNAVNGSYRHAKYLENAEDERRGRH